MNIGERLSAIEKQLDEVSLTKSLNWKVVD